MRFAIFHQHSQFFYSYHKLNYRLEPVSGSSVTNIAYNRSKDCFAVGTFDSSLPIFRQDGSKLCEFPRGDRYLYQLKHTKCCFFIKLEGTLALLLK